MGSRNIETTAIGPQRNAAGSTLLRFLNSPRPIMPPSLRAVKILVNCGICPLLLTKDKVAYIDPGVWVSINRNNWRAKKSKGGWYAYKIETRHGRKIYTYLHRFIMNTPKGQICHHKNGDTLDDRRSNLENVTPSHHEEIHKMRRITRFA